MAERLVDLDELILRCRTDEAREYVREAVAAYRGGAYRACIVATWIGTVYDIVDKIKELELSGDASARAFVRKFENIQEAYGNNDPDALRRSLEFERDILRAAHRILSCYPRMKSRISKG